jgi:hypothetical protein
MYKVQVWFYTGNGYSDVSKFVFESEALRIAREYMSDSLGIRLVSPSGLPRQIKQEVKHA